MSRCIYCLKTEADVAFNGDHSPAKAWGSFQDHPVLHDEVCWPCNQYFGDGLDREFSRGSAEGLLRQLIRGGPVKTLGARSRAQYTLLSEGVELVGRIGAPEVRGIGRQAFNLLAFAKGADFVLQPMFDEARRFFRYGEGALWFCVEPARQSLFDLNTLNPKPAHMFYFQGDGHGVCTRAVFFDLVLYTIFFTRSAVEPFVKFLTFNVQARRIADLTNSMFPEGVPSGRGTPIWFPECPSS